MTATIFIVVSVLTCAAVTVVVKGLIDEAFKQGFKAGHHKGTYDACRQQVDTEKFFRDIESASKTQFPNKN